MKIQADIIKRFENADRRFNQLTPMFAAFVKALDFFSDLRCPVRDVHVSTTEDPLLVLVRYRTVLIGISMLCELSDRGIGTGRIVCSLEKPSFSKEKKIIGSFGFNGQGLTDHEVTPGDDPVSLEYMAPQIVLSFLHLALQKDAA